MRSEVPEQPELWPQELESMGAELDLFECEWPSLPPANSGIGFAVTLAKRPSSGFLERLPTEKARTRLASCAVRSSL